MDRVASQLMAQAYQVKGALQRMKNMVTQVSCQNRVILSARQFLVTGNIAAPPGLATTLPKHGVLAESSCNDTKMTRFTTVMLRNLPNRHSRTMLMDLLDRNCFSGRYDVIFVPADFK